MKNLIVCADGTWNTPDQEDNGIPVPTNVVKLYSCLADLAPAPDGGGTSIEQMSYYHPGVGTEGGLLARTAGGAWGQGLSKNIQSAYHWLARNYQPGDAIYLFGFSRGAYTVRSLGGLLGACGLLNLTDVDVAEGWTRVESVYDAGYRNKQKRSEWSHDWPFHDDSTPVAFIGVWDTVGALGIPDDLAILNLLDRPHRWRFHDTTLGSNVAMARHALALDEVRASFTPTLWTRHAAGSDLRQVWFAGVHGDVGGGYAETGLADSALEWMIAQAEGAGLAFKEAMLQQIHPDPRAVLHDSFKGLFKTQRSRPRNTPAITEPDIHESAKARHEVPPIAQSPYRATTTIAEGDQAVVPVYAGEHWNYTGIYLVPGKYRLRGAGEWIDSSVACGPRGTDDGEFHVGELAHIVGSGLGWLERGWRNVTGHEDADFKMTRRHEQWPWFALIGAVANSDRNPKSDGSPPPHQTFLIGNQKTVTVRNGGYLYCYANDAWDFYGNNRGSVTLRIERLPA